MAVFVLCWAVGHRKGPSSICEIAAQNYRIRIGAVHVHVPHLPPRAVAVACTTLCMLLCPPRNFSQCNSCLFCELLSLQRDHAHTERQSDRPTLAGARSRSAVHKPGKPGAICHMVTPISVHDSSNGGAAGGAGMLNVTQAAAGPVATGPLRAGGRPGISRPTRGPLACAALTNIGEVK